mmetsp:Transcript_23662/g.53972  ORF Transcript_23662/g.53972 Transcript_23662/m.53972 type:complete len:161 (-) Transcript_23662:451-933(-)
MLNESNESCAICLQEFDNENVIHALMPCCEVKTSTIKFCSRCIHRSCKTSSPGEQVTGPCPVCRINIQVDDKGSITVAPPSVEQKGWCRSCRQTRVLVKNSNMCACCRNRRGRSCSRHRSRASQCAPISISPYLSVAQKSFSKKTSLWTMSGLQSRNPSE